MKHQTSSEKGTVIIPEDISEKIKFLCKGISVKEWSGVLFYKVLEGSLEDVEKYKIELVEIFPQDVGSTATTEFNMDTDIIEAYEENEELENCKIGSIHSHNTMGVFYSTTDMDDLKTNCQVYPYLSVVVNNRGERVARLAIPMEKTITGKTVENYTVKVDGGSTINVHNDEKDLEEVEDQILMIDFEIEEKQVEQPIFNTVFMDRFNKIVNAPTTSGYIKTYPASTKVTTPTKNYASTGYSGYGSIPKKIILEFLYDVLSIDGTEIDITVIPYYSKTNNLFPILAKFRDRPTTDLQAHAISMEDEMMVIYEKYKQYEKHTFKDLLDKAITELESYGESGMYDRVIPYLVHPFKKFVK